MIDDTSLSKCVHMAKGLVNISCTNDVCREWEQTHDRRFFEYRYNDSWIIKADNRIRQFFFK